MDYALLSWFRSCIPELGRWRRFRGRRYPHRHKLLNLADLSVLSCGSTDTNDPTCHDTKATGERGGTDKVGRNGPAVVRQGQAADDHARNARDPGSKAAALDPEVTTHQFVDVGRASSSCACSSGVVG